MEHNSIKSSIIMYCNEPQKICTQIITINPTMGTKFYANVVRVAHSDIRQADVLTTLIINL